MVDFLQKVFGQIGDFLKGMPASKKMALLGMIIIVGGGMTWMFFWAGHTTFTPLMTNLSPDDAANVIRILKDKRIPFKVDATGKNITVPPENVDELRLSLASTGLPQSGVVGYEVFDKQNLGTTSFVQRVNQKRALEGELMRTIKSIKGVRYVRVHLALPQKSTFVEDQKKSSASVALDLEPGTLLSEKQIFGIGHLVARAVEGMDQSDVVIVDSEGKLLSRNNADPMAAISASQLDHKQKLEKDTEQRIEAMLSRMVGDGHVVARVTAELDFSQVSETQTIYDGDGAAVRSTQKDTKSMEGSRPGAFGAAGAVSNQPGVQPQPNPMTKNDTKQNAEVTNYEIPQTIRKTAKAVGTLKKLSVAVVVDGKITKTTGKDGKTLTKVDAWPPEKLKEFEDIVASAAGIDKKRGDVLDFKSMEFKREDFEEAQQILNEREKKTYIQNMIVYGVIGITIIMFFLLVVRPFIKWITENTIDSVDTFLPQTLEELEKMQKNQTLPGLEDTVPILPDEIDPEKVEGEMIKEKIVTMIDANPHKAAMILRDWLHTEGTKKKEEGGKDAGKGKSA